MCAGTQSLNTLYFWFGLVAGIGIGFGYSTPIAVMAKWFPDHRGLAVGLAVAGFGGGSAIFGPLCRSYLIPHHGWPATFRILSGIFLVMTTVGAFLLQNPPANYAPEGWAPDPVISGATATPYDFTPGAVLRTRTFYLMWIAYALGTSAGLMVISQLKPFAKGEGISEWAASTALLVGAVGSAAGRTLSGWMSDALGRLNVLRLMIGLSVVAMPLLYASVGSLTAFFVLVFVVYWCFGTQLSVNASTAADFWGTKNAGINYGILYTAYGVAGVIGPRIGATLFDAHGHYRTAFTVAAVPQPAFTRSVCSAARAPSGRACRAVEIRTDSLPGGPRTVTKDPGRVQGQRGTRYNILTSTACLPLRSRGHHDIDARVLVHRTCFFVAHFRRRARGVAQAREPAGAGGRAIAR